jgi:hypothetical protein
VQGPTLIWRKGVELACRGEDGVGIEEGPRMDVRLTSLDAGDEGAGTAVSRYDGRSTHYSSTANLPSRRSGPTSRAESSCSGREDVGVPVIWAEGGPLGRGAAEGDGEEAVEEVLEWLEGRWALQDATCRVLPQLDRKECGEPGRKLRVTCRDIQDTDHDRLSQGLGVGLGGKRLVRRDEQVEMSRGAMAVRC